MPLATSPVPSLDELVQVNAPAAPIARLHNMPVEEAEVYPREPGHGEELFIVPAHSDVAFQERNESEGSGGGTVVAQRMGRKR